MLGAVGASLTSERGGWVVLVATGAICALAGLSVGVSTFLLSVEAILLTQAVLVYQGQRECRDDVRDKALHAKLDELLRGVPQADSELAGIEEREAGGR